MAFGEPRFGTAIVAFALFVLVLIGSVSISQRFWLVITIPVGVVLAYITFIAAGGFGLIGQFMTWKAQNQRKRGGD